MNLIKKLPILLLLGLVYACGGSSKSGSGALTYQGPGSRWEVVLDGSTFNLIKYPNASSSTAELTLAGSFTRQATNKFLTMTVASSSDVSEVPLGTVVNALEIPNTAILIRTPDNAVPLVATIKGACPTSTLNGNWILTKPRLEAGDFIPGNLDNDGSGVVTYTPGSRIVTRAAGINGREFEAAPGPGDGIPLSGSTCSNGLLSVNVGGDIFDMYFTASGLIVVKFPEDAGEQIIFGLPRQSSAVTDSSLQGNYSAFVFEGGGNITLSEATLTPAKITIASNGDFNIESLSSIPNNTTGAALDTVIGFSTTFTSVGGAPNSNGLFHGDLSGVGEKITCATSVIGGTRILACYGFTGSGENRRPFTIVGHSI